MCTSKKSFSLWTKSIIRYIDRAIVRTTAKSLKNSLQKYLVSTLNGTSLRKIAFLKAIDCSTCSGKRIYHRVTHIEENIKAYYSQKIEVFIIVKQDIESKKDQLAFIINPEIRNKPVHLKAIFSVGFSKDFFQMLFFPFHTVNHIKIV